MKRPNIKERDLGPLGPSTELSQGYHKPHLKKHIAKKAAISKILNSILFKVQLKTPVCYFQHI